MKVPAFQTVPFQGPAFSTRTTMGWDFGSMSVYEVIQRIAFVTMKGYTDIRYMRLEKKLLSIAIKML